MKLTKPQLAALKNYADGKPHFRYTKMRVIERLFGMGLLERMGDYMQQITDKGRAALEDAAMTVYGGTYDGRRRVIVAAPTKKAAYQAMKGAHSGSYCGSYSTWSQYTSETGNEEECRVARAEPLTVFHRLDQNGTTFEKVKP